MAARPRTGNDTGGGPDPLGSSVGPLAGPTYVIIGDAGAATNPLTGLGIDTALETGIMAGDVVGEALDAESAAVQQYPKLVDDRYGAYYKFGRLTERALGQPSLLPSAPPALGSRRSFAEGALQVGLQHLRRSRRRPRADLPLGPLALGVFVPDA
ncbi:MAG: hypothetical protein R2705_21875 [Ilumatobacteraceae bacterium]